MKQRYLLLQTNLISSVAAKFMTEIFVTQSYYECIPYEVEYTVLNLVTALLINISRFAWSKEPYMYNNSVFGSNTTILQVRSPTVQYPDMDEYTSKATHSHTLCIQQWERCHEGTIRWHIKTIWFILDIEIKKQASLPVWSRHCPKSTASSSGTTRSN